MASVLCNPLTSADFWHPFILQWAGEYWAFGDSGGSLRLLHSRDLVRWNAVGSVLEGASSCHVSYHDGVFYLYYVAEAAIRVASAEAPDGPYRSMPAPLLNSACDPYVFTDADGTRYLFYATDEGTEVDRLIDPLRLAHEPRRVTPAAKAPAVLQHKGVYYQLCVNDALRCATASSLFDEDLWTLQDHPLANAAVRAVPVLGPAGQLYVACNDATGAMCVERLEYVGRRLMLPEQSTPDPRQRPAAPRWMATDGAWTYDGDGATQASSTHAVAELRDAARSSAWWAEVTLRSTHALGPDQAVGVSLLGKSAALIAVRLGSREVVIADLEGGWGEVRVPLPSGWRPDVWHVLRLEAYDERLRLTLDGWWQWQGRWDYELLGVALCTWKAAAEFRGYARLDGWEDRFDEVEGSPRKLGWEGDDGWRVVDGQLHAPRGTDAATQRKGPLLSDYELALNMRVDGEAGGFCPALTDDDDDPRFVLRRQGGAWEWTLAPGEHGGLMPVDFDGTEYHQFRARRRGGQMSLWCGALLLAEVEGNDEPAEIGLYAEGGASFDMVRVTALREEDHG